jgi:hypothetical protein
VSQIVEKCLATPVPLNKKKEEEEEEEEELPRLLFSICSNIFRLFVL